MASHSDAMVRSAALRNSAFNLAKSISIGFKSGEQSLPGGGRGGR